MITDCRRVSGPAKTVLVAAAAIALAGCGASATTANSAATAAGSGDFKAACPSTAEITSALGRRYPAVKRQSDGGTLTCTYSNSDDFLVVLFASLPGTSVADVKSATDAAAKGGKATVHAVPGLGDGAYEFSSTASGSVQTVVDILAGSEDIDITSDVSPARTETLARDILGR